MMRAIVIRFEGREKGRSHLGSGRAIALGNVIKKGDRTFGKEGGIAFDFLTYSSQTPSHLWDGVRQKLLIDATPP